MCLFCNGNLSERGGAISLWKYGQEKGVSNNLDIHRVRRKVVDFSITHSTVSISINLFVNNNI